jgi:predicted RNA binding protein YcfA (HicA-like mRNA interferase family)
VSDYENQVREILSKDGWEFKRHGKGDHSIWHHPEKPEKGSVTVDGKIKSRHTANKILKDAGLKTKL